MTMFDRHKILKAHYKKEIKEWGWAGILKDCVGNQVVKYGQRLGRAWIGTIRGLTPSGKIYAPWTTNPARSDVTRDTAWWEALQEEAKERGGWIDSEGGDIYVMREIEEE